MHACLRDMRLNRVSMIDETLQQTVNTKIL